MKARQTHGLSWVIPANEYRRERWRNGLGWTREIHAHATAGSSDDWAWRLSIAEIEQDAPFSAFPGIDRELVLLSGNGLRLRFDDGEVRELHPPHDKLRFVGERAVTGELLDGPTQDFNLMWRRDLVEAQLWHRPLVGPMVVFAEPGTMWVVHLLAGQARFADESGLPDLAATDTALLRADDTRLRHVLDGAGEALLIRLQQRQ
jgi:environmental stress-induced protein Ves